MERVTVAKKRKTTPYVERRIAARKRAAHEQNCSNCGRSVMAGPDADVMACVAVVDPVPVSAAEELLARAVGTWAYRVFERGEYLELVGPRDRWQVWGEPANPDDGRAGGLYAVVVYLEHRCPDGTAFGRTTGSRYVP